MDLAIFKNYLLGIYHLDDAHRELFTVFNDLHSHSNSKEDLIKQLLFYKYLSEKHFKEEEDYMADIKFPYIGSHKESHCGIIRKINKLVDMLYNSESPNMKAYCNNELDYTFLEHIDHFDSQIALYVKKNA